MYMSTETVARGISMMALCNCLRKAFQRRDIILWVWSFWCWNENSGALYGRGWAGSFEQEYLQRIGWLFGTLNHIKALWLSAIWHWLPVSHRYDMIWSVGNRFFFYCWSFKWKILSTVKCKNKVGYYNNLTIGELASANSNFFNFMVNLGNMR